MAYNPMNPNGQATAANSTPAVLASDQFALASAITDGTANFTATTIESATMAYNGTTWDRIRTSDAVSGTSSNDTVKGIIAVASGPGYGIRYNPTNLATAAQSTSILNVEGASTSAWVIQTTTSGTFIFEGSADAVAYYPVEVFDATNDRWVTNQNITPTSGNTYYVACAGLRTIRIRTTATLGATVAHNVNLSNGGQTISAIDTGFAPHNFGYLLWHKDIASATTLTSLTIYTPTSGKRFVVTDLTVNAGGTTAGTVTIYDATAATAFTNQVTPAVFRGEFAPSTTSRPGFSKTFSVPYYSAAINNSLLITTSAAMTIYVQVNGYEI